MLRVLLLLFLLLCHVFTSSHPHPNHQLCKLGNPCAGCMLCVCYVHAPSMLCACSIHAPGMLCAMCQLPARSVHTLARSVHALSTLCVRSVHAPFMLQARSVHDLFIIRAHFMHAPKIFFNIFPKRFPKMFLRTNIKTIFPKYSKNISDVESPSVSYLLKIIWWNMF